MRVLRNYFDDLSNITLHDTNNRRSAVLSCKNHIIYIEIDIVSWVNVCHSLNRRSTTAEFPGIYAHKRACGNAHGNLATKITMRRTYTKQNNTDRWQYFYGITIYMKGGGFGSEWTDAQWVFL